MAQAVSNQRRTNPIRRADVDDQVTFDAEAGGGPSDVREGLCVAHAQRAVELRRDDRRPNALPTASTCFNTLRLPKYATVEQVRKGLCEPDHGLFVQKGFTMA